MMKPMLLATSMLFAIPAVAQEAPVQDKPAQTAPVPEQATPPVASDDAAPAAQDQATPAATAEATPAPAEPATQPAEVASAPAAAPTAQPAATQEQVAQAVGRDFGGYDKDSDGKLSATEFASWMGDLRKASEPGFQPGSAEATSWSSQAFASADTDKNASVNKQELTVFLTPKQPG